MTVSPEILAARPTPEQVEAAKAAFLYGAGFDVWHRCGDASGAGEFTQLTIHTHHVYHTGACALHFRLKGNHMEQYRGLVDQGRDACLLYYRDHLAEAHHLTDRLVERHFECLWATA